MDILAAVAKVVSVVFVNSVAIAEITNYIIP